jgi:hypothetical protein
VSGARFFALQRQLFLEHNPEKWIPVSRLREALAEHNNWVDASAGEGRSEKIMLHQRSRAG